MIFGAKMDTHAKLINLINRLVPVYGVARVYAELNGVTGTLEGRDERKVEHLKKYFANK